MRPTHPGSWWVAVAIAAMGGGCGDERGKDCSHAGGSDAGGAADLLACERSTCTFAAGASAEATVGLDETTRVALPIRHVIVVMKENRSFDHLFGALGAMQPEAETFSSEFSNPDPHGHPVAPYHLNTTCLQTDLGHQWQEMHDQVHAGRMDGFSKVAGAYTGTDGWFALGYYNEQDLPFYYWLASTFALADHYFPSVRSGTFPNRDYLLLGTSDKVYSTGSSVWPDPSLKIIFDELDSASVSWGVYATVGEEPFEGCLDDPSHAWKGQRDYKTTETLSEELAAGTAPSVMFVDARSADEHPPADVQVGEAWTRRLYAEVVGSPIWDSTVILFTYDESGGFFDHVPPADDACLARPADRDFHELGIRVPLIAISPWSRRHFVSHIRKEHTSITRFIEAVFGLPALTARDANSDALLDMFDFETAPAPLPPAPSAGVGGCRGPRVTTDKSTYLSGEPITITFENGPGHQTDWIGVYPLGTMPASASTIFGYVGGGGHVASSGRTDGAVVLSAGSENKVGDWPLNPGQWAAWFLVGGSYTSIASAEFVVR